MAKKKRKSRSKTGSGSRGSNHNVLFGDPQKAATDAMNSAVPKEAGEYYKKGKLPRLDFG